jgi:hypothetical protein
MSARRQMRAQGATERVWASAARVDARRLEEGALH